MCAPEFVVRLCGAALPPLVYSQRALQCGGTAAAPHTWLRDQGQHPSPPGAGAPPAECYYLQAALPEALMLDLGLTGLLAELAAAAPEAATGDCGAPRPGGGAALAPSISQAPRLWVSAHGSVSPLHYDASHSLLFHVHGHAKRMLFFPPEQLPYLYLYPDTHLLRRRSRVNVAAPDLTRHPLFARTHALEAMLHPGDAVFFPPEWAHYTESLAHPAAAEQALGAAAHAADPDDGCCMSVTCRFCESTP
jgi:hypothetical protein